MATGSSDQSPMSAGERATLASVRGNSDAEVICIVRPRGSATTRSEVIVLDRASSVFLDQLDAERATQESRRYTSHEVRDNTARRDDAWRQTR